MQFFCVCLFRSLSNMSVASKVINPWLALFYQCFLNYGKPSRRDHDSNITKFMNECHTNTENTDWHNFVCLFCNNSCINDKIQPQNVCVSWVMSLIYFFFLFLKRGLEYGWCAWIDLSEFSRWKKLCCPDLKSMLTSEKALKSRNDIRYSRERIYNSHSLFSCDVIIFQNREISILVKF